MKNKFYSLSSKIVFLVIILSVQTQSFGQNVYRQILNMVDSVSTENLTNHIKWLEEPGGHNSRVNFTPGNDSASAYIKREFDKITGLSYVSLDTFFIPSASSPYNNKPLVNVVASLDGDGPSDSYYVIGAHLDCSASRMGSSIWNSQWNTITAPGADDNATGIAAIIEIARILSDPANEFNHYAGIKFIAFGAEESGPAYSGSHHGSRHYAQYAKQNNHNVRGMVSIDMIGYNNNYDFQSIVANNQSSSFGARFIDVNEMFNIGLILNEPPFPASTYSDHDTFWDEGYSAILLIEHAPPWSNGTYYTKNPYYHKSTDTYETLNMELVTKVTKLNLATFAAFSAPLTDVEDDEVVPPADIILAQNYPNPFNPSTKIRFKIPNVADALYASPTKLVVYDMLGNEVSTLLDDYKLPGIYEIEFNAAGLASGVYVYRLMYGEKVLTKQMILLK